MKYTYRLRFTETREIVVDEADDATREDIREAALDFDDVTIHSITEF